MVLHSLHLTPVNQPHFVITPQTLIRLPFSFIFSKPIFCISVSLTPCHYPAPGPKHPSQFSIASMSREMTISQAVRALTPSSPCSPLPRQK